MSSGRFIANSICADKKVNQLSDDTSRLAFTWLITFADVDGRTPGDPAVVRSMLFPRRQDVTIEQMAGYIQEWAKAGMVYWYEADDDMWIEFPNFHKHQKIQRNREAQSKIPARVTTSNTVENDPEITPELLQSYSSITPEQIPIKLKEKKLKEQISLLDDEIATVYNTVAGGAGLPSSEREDILVSLRALSVGRTRDELVEYLRPFYKAFREGPAKNKTRSYWLTDWAVRGEIPGTVQRGSEPKPRQRLVI